VARGRPGRTPRPRRSADVVATPGSLLTRYRCGGGGHRATVGAPPVPARKRSTPCRLVPGTSRPVLGPSGSSAAPHVPSRCSASCPVARHESAVGRAHSAPGRPAGVRRALGDSRSPFRVSRPERSALDRPPFRDAWRVFRGYGRNRGTFRRRSRGTTEHKKSDASRSSRVAAAKPVTPAGNTGPVGVTSRCRSASDNAVALPATPLRIPRRHERRTPSQADRSSAATSAGSLTCGCESL
jgi:hypothetical protein